MPTLGDIYNPLIEAAKVGDAQGHALLREVGETIFQANRDRCSNVADGIRAARENLDYYCQYFDAKTANQVKEFYRLGAGFRALSGEKFETEGE